MALVELTEELAREGKKLLLYGHSTKWIAEKLNVSQVDIRELMRGKAWSWLPWTDEVDA